MTGQSKCSLPRAYGAPTQGGLSWLSLYTAAFGSQSGPHMAVFAVGAPRVLNVEAHPSRPQCVATCAFCDDHLALVTSTAVQIWGGGQVRF